MATRYFTKSCLNLALSCPRKLLYTGKPQYANVNDGNELLKILADGGFQVGELAKLMYPSGVEIATKNSEEALVKTAELLRQDSIVLFAPAIAYKDCLVRVDVLVKSGHVFQVIEVTAKSYPGDQSIPSAKIKFERDIRQYVKNVAFQKFVVEKAFPAYKVSAYLLMPDKSKHANVNGMNQLFKVRHSGSSIEVLVDPRALVPGLAESVLTCVDIDPLVNAVLDKQMTFPGGQGMLAELASRWADAYQRDEGIPPHIGGHCKGCEFKAELGSTLRCGYRECWKQANGWTEQDFEQGTVLDIWNFKGKSKLIQRGVLKMSEVSPEDLKLTDDDLYSISSISAPRRRWLQVNGLPEDCAGDGFYLDREGLALKMRRWTYPFHFIDFETAAMALPFNAGRSPYEPVAFQFSHHVMEEDGSIRHADEFLLAAPGVFPNYEFIRALREALLKDTGTIFRWSLHENTILDAIKKQLKRDDTPPFDQVDLIDFIDSVTKGGPRAMVDLADVALKHYFHPITKGSCSIKKVLPAVMQSSAFLKSEYSQPVYGRPGGIVSKNFKSMTWWQQDAEGRVMDPYKLLLDALTVGDESDDAAEEGINQGGAASYAYMRLQLENIDDIDRSALRSALLRYCELDTLAMAFILQSWVY
jgi:hypothetical protein